MNLNHLAIFHAVAREGSVTKAAERLMISQPAISKQLKQLEKSLGVRLFDRRPRGVHATEAGELLASYAGRLFALAEESERAIGELCGLQRGRLRVGASTTIGVYLLPEIFVRFRSLYPGVQLQLEIAGSEMLAERLLNGAIDVALTEGEIRDASLESSVVMRDRLVVIARRNHPLSRKRSVTAARLCKEPFVVRETGSGTQSLVERTLAERGLTIKPAMSLGSTEAIKRAVASGVGVAIVSGLSVSLELAAKKLAIVKCPELEMQRPVYRVAMSNAYVSQSVQTFDTMLGELAERGGR